MCEWPAPMNASSANAETPVSAPRPAPPRFWPSTICSWPAPNSFGIPAAVARLGGGEPAQRRRDGRFGLPAAALLFDQPQPAGRSAKRIRCRRRCRLRHTIDDDCWATAVVDAAYSWHRYRSAAVEVCVVLRSTSAFGSAGVGGGAASLLSAILAASSGRWNFRFVRLVRGSLLLVPPRPTLRAALQLARRRSACDVVRCRRFCFLWRRLQKRRRDCRRGISAESSTSVEACRCIGDDSYANRRSLRRRRRFRPRRFARSSQRKPAAGARAAKAPRTCAAAASGPNAFASARSASRSPPASCSTSSTYTSGTEARPMQQTYVRAV